MRKVSLRIKKKVGNSQFIKQKLQEEYDPKVRIKSQIRSPFEAKRINTLAIQNQQRQKVGDRTISQIKEGKKIMIDWTTKYNFRATFKLPQVYETKQTSFSQNYKQLQNKKLSLTDIKIQQKNNHLSYLLQKRGMKRRFVKRQRSLRTQPSQLSPKSSLLISSPEKYQSFTLKYEQKIKEAIKCESAIEKCLDPEQITKVQNDLARDKKKMQFLKQKLKTRSKLALIKSELIKKYKQTVQADEEKLNKIFYIN